MSVILVPGQYEIGEGSFSHPSLSFTFNSSVTLPDPTGLTVDEYRFLISGIADLVFGEHQSSTDATEPGVAPVEETPADNRLTEGNFVGMRPGQTFIPVDFEAPVSPIAVSGTGVTFRFDKIKRGGEHLYMQVFPVEGGMSLVLPFALKSKLEDVTLLESALNTLGDNLKTNPTAFVAFLAQLAFSPSGIGLYKGEGGIPQVYYFNTTHSVEDHLGDIDFRFDEDFGDFFPGSYTEPVASDFREWLTANYGSVHPFLLPE